MQGGVLEGAVFGRKCVGGRYVDREVCCREKCVGGRCVWREVCLAGGVLKGGVLMGGVFGGRCVGGRCSAQTAAAGDHRQPLQMFPLLSRHAR